MGDKKASIDINKVKRFFASDLPKPNLYYSTHPIKNLENNRILNEWFSRLILKKLLILLPKIESYTSSEKFKTSYQLLDELFELDCKDVSLFFRRPEITHVLSQLEEKVQNHDNNIEELCIHFNTFLLFFIFSRKNIKKTKKVQIALTNPTSLNLYSTNKAIIFPIPVTGYPSVEIKGDSLVIYNGNIKYLIPRKENLQSSDSECIFAELPSLNEMLLIKDDAFYERFFPFKGTHRDAVWKDINEENFSTWYQCLRESMSLLKKYWSEGWNEFKENIFQLAPLKPETFNNPQNYSLHSLRGMIFTSFRPPYMIAQSLMHEAGHNKFSTVLDLCTITKNSFEEKYYSPFVQIDRPLSFIIHGIFSFLRDLDISYRLINNLTEANTESIEKYIKLIQPRLQHGIDVVKQNAIFTENGTILMESLENNFNRIKS